MTTGRILNIPNILTLARIALIPVFLVIAYWPPAIGIGEHVGSMTRHIILTAIFVLAAVTDWFKTAFQMIAISVFLLNWQPLEMLAYALLYTAVILTLWSMFIYLKAAWPYLKQP